MSRRGLCQTLVVVAVCLGGCHRENPAPPGESLPVVPVKVARVERIVAAGSQSVAGTVRPFERAVVAARITGAVAEANFAIGQKVMAGEIVLKIQADELEARFEQARATLAQAERDVTRETALLTRGAATEESVRSAEDRLRVARAAHAEAKTLMSYTEVPAPFAGSITRKPVNSGDFAAMGTPLFEIEARNRLRADIEVPETLPALTVGAEVPVLGVGGTIVVTGRIAELSFAVSAITRTRSVIVDLPANALFHSGEFVRVQWPGAEAAALVIPAEAVRLFGQIEQVFVVAGDRAVLRIVKTGAREKDRVQILSGLEGGEQVIVAPPAGLRDGHPIRVAP